MDKLTSTTIESFKLPDPCFMYGTAWKEDATQRLTETALMAGFRAIDTANQRKHYYEAGVGDAIAAAIERGLVSRSELFLQTKFTFRDGQDHRLPYDPAASVGLQVQQSFASSLSHLKTEYIDSYVLHGPSQRPGLGNKDWDAWHAMEEIYNQGKVRQLGISNVTLEQLMLLYEQAQVKPRFVQNRCYAIFGWDYHVRQYCLEKGITYQGFSLLTANRDVLMHPKLVQIAEHHGRSVNQVVFRFAIQIGMLPLTGTTNAEHMRDDLGVWDFTLSADEVSFVERVGLTR